MKKINIVLIALTISTILVSCNDNFKIDGTGIPKAPILREIVLPDANNSNPGTDVTIQGKGFAMGDKVYLKNESGTLEVELKSVAEGNMIFAMPETAGGEYSVVVEREKLQTTLPGILSVPYLMVLKNIVLPEVNFSKGSSAWVQADGFASGDSVYLTNSSYPSTVVLKTKATLSGNKLSFNVPADAYGINTVIAVRWENGNVRKGTVGSIGVKSTIGDVVGGGIVYYMIDEVHGLICSPKNITDTPVKYGPSISTAANTSFDIGKGKENTDKLMKQITDWRATGAGVWLTTKTVPEIVLDYSVTVNGNTYNDWFLPSLNELAEIFKIRSFLGTKGAAYKNDNYWSSSERRDSGWSWAQYYINFYEPVNLVTGQDGNREVWAIGIIPIRAF